MRPIKFIDSRIRVGTRVLLEGGTIDTVTSVDFERWIKVSSLMGSYQMAHIITFSNTQNGDARLRRRLSELNKRAAEG